MDSLDQVLKTQPVAPAGDSATDDVAGERPDGLTYESSYAFSSAVVSGAIRVVAGINLVYQYSSIEVTLQVGDRAYLVRFTADELDTIADSVSNAKIIAAVLAEAPDKSWQGHIVEGRYGGEKNLHLTYGYKQRLLSSNQLNCVIRKPTWSGDDGWQVPVEDKTVKSFRDAAVAIRAYETLTAAHVERVKAELKGSGQ